MPAHLAAQLAHAPQFLDHFLRRAAYVGHAVGVAYRHWGDDALRTRLQCILGTAQVRGQYRNQQAWVGQCVGDHLFGVGHLRQQPGRHERGNFHVAHASGIRAVDPAQLGGSRHDRLQALQAIAQADFIDCYCCHQGALCLKRVARLRAAWRAEKTSFTG
ncbi:hypothetical protein D3C79_855380 [compost metagenome]